MTGAHPWECMMLQLPLRRPAVVLETSWRAGVAAGGAVIFGSCKGSEVMLMAITDVKFAQPEAKMQETLKKLLNAWADVEFLFD
eukprot:5936886-Lingulodinium_polyedra.AAC.1